MHKPFDYGEPNVFKSQKHVIWIRLSCINRKSDTSNLQLNAILTKTGYLYTL